MASITLENLYVDFPIYGAHKTFRSELFHRATGGLIRREGKRRRVTIRALDGLNLTIREGDRLGLIGHNGAGKSTLLKVFAGVYEPTGGRISIEGRLSPLFNLAPGWDPEDTGYENIMNCGLFLGMTPEEVKRKTPEIAEVTGLGSYLDLPARTYSAGMTLRLAFSIATSIDPEILLLDEGLSAGDASFAAVAEARINNLLSRSRILIMASHSTELLKNWCNKAILLERGCVISAGTVAEVAEVYHSRPKELVEPLTQDAAA
jgi:ABC-2 type transport system ATP-binding protein/lipopolysaccharide transport system ATP-binding protein